MFLRHLRRTRLLLQVVDASAADPGTDYLAVREELRMYNPDYVTRPHVVALNKVDLEDAGECACGQLVSAHKVGMGAACESVYLEIGEPRDQQQACVRIGPGRLAWVELGVESRSLQLIIPINWHALSQPTALLEQARVVQTASLWHSTASAVYMAVGRAAVCCATSVVSTSACAWHGWWW
jgi:hypothetical protein